MRTQLVSVIIASRNRLRLLQRAIDSVNIQTYPEIEIIVFDNFSDKPIRQTDLQSRLPVKIVRSDVFQPASVSRNSALEACEGTYISYLDDDDEYLAGKVEDQAAALQESPDVMMVYGNTEQRLWNRSIITSTGPPDLDYYLLFRHIHLNAITLRREILDRVAFDPAMRRFGDVKFIATVLRHFKTKHIDRLHAVWYRDNRPDQLTHRNYQVSYRHWKLLCREFRPVLVKVKPLRLFYFGKMLILSLMFLDFEEALISLRTIFYES